MHAARRGSCPSRHTQGTPSLEELKKKYYELMIRYHAHERDYLEICRAYRAIYEEGDPEVGCPARACLGLECRGSTGPCLSWEGEAAEPGPAPPEAAPCAGPAPDIGWPGTPNLHAPLPLQTLKKICWYAVLSPRDSDQQTLLANTAVRPVSTERGVGGPPAAGAHAAARVTQPTGRVHSPRCSRLL